MNQDDEPRRQWNYELLGAPVLLYRNEASYTELDLPAHTVTQDALDDIQAAKRARARWYYPIDFHRVRHVTGELSDKNDEQFLPAGNLATHYGRKRKRKEKDNKKIDKEEAAKLEKKNQILKVASRLEKEQITLLRDRKFLSEQNLDLQQEARLVLLRGHDRDASKNILWSYQHNDTNMYPGKFRLIRNDGRLNNTCSFQFGNLQQERLSRYAKERLNNADPAYLCPFQQTSWMDLYELDGTRTSGKEESDTRFANEYGNCIVSFPCSCTICDKVKSPAWWFLHPVGPLLETIQLSHFATPNGRQAWRAMKFSGGLIADGSGKMVSTSKRRVLDTGDSVREIMKCGENLFVARGTCYFTIFRILHGEPTKNPDNEELCLGGAQVLVLVDRVDLRSFIRGAPSYRPRNMTSHPRYGEELSDARVAVVCELENREVCNSIRQYNIGEEIRSTEHSIASLQLISNLQYSSFHPMVLWASARSYVRPLPTSNHLRGFPRVGFGTALFSIDLRSDKAAFQWSPSVEEFATEGTHSVSNILTDWGRDNTLFVSSISSKKTWELDMRMPCRSVTSWSLPHYGEGYGAETNRFGCFGAGMLFERPSSVHGRGLGDPIFAVNTTPGSAGIHLYQRPSNRPNFQCPPMESIFTQGVNASNVCVAASMMFPLPDVAGSVFTCGLSSIRVPTTDLFPSEENLAANRIVDRAPTTICVVSSTNKGDVYVHPLLESASEEALSRGSDSLPLGGSSVFVPHENVVPAQRSALFNSFPLNLTNEYPIPSSAIIAPLKQKRRSEWKVSEPWEAQFTEQEDSVLVHPSGTQSVALSTGAGQSVHLRASLMETQKKAFYTTLDSFNDDLLRSQRKQIRQNKHIYRTDLTGETIENAELDWTTGFSSDQGGEDW
eukprot:scaffold12636_cov176-Amphora_coffeaeformis.AAC.3